MSRNTATHDDSLGRDRVSKKRKRAPEEKEHARVKNRKAGRESTPTRTEQDDTEQKPKKTKKKRSKDAADPDGEKPSRREDEIDDAPLQAPENNQDDQDDQDPVPKKYSKILNKFEKAVKKGDKPPQEQEDTEPEDEAATQLRDLVPIPRPQAASGSRALPTFSALPSWMTDPVRVPPDLRQPFQELCLDGSMVKHLESKGLTDALAVQAAVIPLLTPGTVPHSICVSAATGSGKTLAYALPIVQALRQRLVPKLSAVLIVPTRELVTQAREVLELCISGTDLKIGTAVGSQTLKSEQEALVERVMEWDPSGYERQQSRIQKPVSLEEYYIQGLGHDLDIRDAVDALPGHVASYVSKVDILICTPGRLVEHIKSTRGFSLKDLEYLVIDEADRLLDDSFQEWSSVVNQAIAEAEAPDISDLRMGALLSIPVFRKVRKIMLSATMTRDLGKLASLKLDAPKLIIVGEEPAPAQDAAQSNTTGGFAVPTGLEEFAMPVGDGSQKPLYLIQLLDEIFGNPPTLSHAPKGSKAKKDELSDASSSDTSSYISSSDDSSDLSSSDESSDLSSSDNSSSVDSTDEDVDMEDKNSMSSGYESDKSSEAAPEPTGVLGTAPQQASSVLVFAGSSVSALRLSRLISHLAPAYAQVTTTITRSSSKSETKQIIAGLRTGQVKILIASDRVSRGLDVPELSHVINYDVPSSVASYIHRVGRTARAGRQGAAWTLLQHNQARWFWREIGRAESVIQRAPKTVDRIRLAQAGEWSDVVMREYGRVLERLKREVFERRGQGGAARAIMR